MKIKNRRVGLTFLEIMIALAVLVIALLPIFKMIHKGAEDTDITASQTYAITKASEILNTILDTIPFEVLRQGNPGLFCSTDIAGLAEYKNTPVGQDPSGDYARSYCELLFGTREDRHRQIIENRIAPRKPGGKSQGDGWRCEGVVTDLRGISYRLWLYIEDIYDEQPDNVVVEEKDASAGDFGRKFNARDELTFSFYKNPAKLSDPSWTPKYQDNTVSNSLSKGARHELDLTTPVAGIAVPDGSVNIYNLADYVNPKQARFCQRLVCDANNYGHPSTPDKPAYCSIKRLIIEVQWNLDRRYYNQPEKSHVGNPQRIHLMTLKGDIGR